MRVRLLCTYMNIKYKNYQWTNRGNVIFTKHFFYNLITTQNWEVSPQVSKSCSKHKFSTSWQHFVDQQEFVFTAHRVKLNVAAKGEDYSFI
jgi:hypothetical protein